MSDTAKRWSWVHVDDLADAYVRILDNPRAVDERTFAVTDDQSISALDM
ncbi:NAD-dependent epimerase/dehydratase family protein, partial [Streptomyces broussonetiae]